jgi:hypothetical protein
MSETVDEKAARYLVEGRVKVCVVTASGVEAQAQGGAATA